MSDEKLQKTFDALCEWIQETPEFKERLREAIRERVAYGPMSCDSYEDAPFAIPDIGKALDEPDFDNLTPEHEKALWHRCKMWLDLVGITDLMTLRYAWHMADRVAILDEVTEAETGRREFCRPLCHAGEKLTDDDVERLGLLIRPIHHKDWKWKGPGDTGN